MIRTMLGGGTTLGHLDASRDSSATFHFSDFGHFGLFQFTTFSSPYIFAPHRCTCTGCFF